METEIQKDKIEAGETLRVQLCPYGNWANGSINQVCDEEAFENLVSEFESEVLVDFDHEAETGGSTAAAGWLQALAIDEELGLVGEIKFTDSGAEAVTARRMRYLSPCWEIDSDGRPSKLISVGLTNKPNIPVACMLNRADSVLTSNSVEQHEDKTMDRIIALLGLAPEATEDDVISAITSLQDAVAKAAEEALNSEAEAAIDEHEECLANREAWKAAYIANPEQTRTLLNSLRKVEQRQAPCEVLAESVQKVCNSSLATAPTSVDIMSTIRSYSSPEERVKAIQANMGKF